MTHAPACQLSSRERLSADFDPRVIASSISDARDAVATNSSPSRRRHPPHHCPFAPRLVPRSRPSPRSPPFKAPRHKPSRCHAVCPSSPLDNTRAPLDTGQVVPCTSRPNPCQPVESPCSGHSILRTCSRLWSHWLRLRMFSFVLFLSLVSSLLSLASPRLPCHRTSTSPLFSTSHPLSRLDSTAFNLDTGLFSHTTPGSLSPAGHSLFDFSLSFSPLSLSLRSAHCIATDSDSII